MLSLKTNTNEIIDLAPSARATINFINPAFDPNHVSRVFAYPYPIPATPANSKSFKHANRLDSAKDFEAIQGTLQLGGIPFDDGAISFSKFNTDRLEVTLKNESLKVFEALSEYKLNEILDTVEIPQTLLPSFKFIFAEPAPGNFNFYQIEIRDTLFYYDAQAGDNSGDVALALFAQIDNVYPGLATYATFPDGSLTLSPTLGNPALINFDTLNANTTIDTARGVALAHSLNFEAWLNEQIATPNSMVSFPSYHNAGLYGFSGTNWRFYGWVNPTHDGAYVLNDLHEQRLWDYSYTPYIRVPYVLSKIASLVGLDGLKGDVFESADFQSLLIYSNRTLDLVDFEHYPEGPRYQNGFLPEIDLNLFVQSMTGSDFVSAIAQSLNCYTIIENNHLVFIKKSDQLRKSAINITAQTSPKYLSEKVNRKGFIIQFPTDETNTYQDPAQLQPLDRSNQNGAFTVTLSAGTLNFDAQFFDSTKKVPTLTQEGISSAIANEANLTPLKLIFDRGWQPDESSLPYHFASHDNINMNGVSVGELSLELNDLLDGLFVHNFFGQIEFQHAQPITVSVLLPLQQIIELRRWQVSRVLINHPEGQINGAIKSLKVKATAQDIQPVIMELLY